MLGLSITDSEARLVEASGTAAEGKLSVKVVEKIPKGAVEGGVVQGEEKLIESLKKLRKKAKSPKVTVCVPAEKVYTTLLNVTPEKGKNFDACMKDAFDRTIPEDRSKLFFRTAVVRRSGGTGSVATVAINRTLLQGYKDACRKAGFTVVGLTTLPLSLGDLARGWKGKSVLTVAPGVGGLVASVFSRGYIIDEALMSDTATTARKEVLGLIEEYKEKHKITLIVVIGDKSLAEALKKDLKEEKSIEVRTDYTWKADAKNEWASAAITSMAGPSPMLGGKPRSTGSLVVLLLLSLAASAGLLLTMMLQRPDLLGL